MLYTGLLLCGSITSNAHTGDNTIPETSVFQIEDQNPLLPANTLPVATHTQLLNRGEILFQTALTLSNSVNIQHADHERVFFDYEAYRLTLSMDYAPITNWNIGIRIPITRYSGGVTDTLIDRFHTAFGFREGARPYVATDQLRIQYSSYDNNLRIEDKTLNLGDISLHLQHALLNTEQPPTLLIATLKLPTGNTDALNSNHASILSTEIAHTQRITEHWEIYSRIGISLLQHGNILASQQKRNVTFATAACNWKATPNLQLRIQFDAHTPLYRSNLRLLGDALIFTVGGSWQIAETIGLDTALSEDIKVEASPDVALHIGLRFSY